MKKAYSKPEIVFENFMSSTNIAACKVDTNLPSTNNCGISFVPGQVVFLDSSTGCNVPSDCYDICYDNPSDTNRLFGSSFLTPEGRAITVARPSSIKLR